MESLADEPLKEMERCPREAFFGAEEEDFTSPPEATAVVSIGRLAQALPVVCSQLRLCASATLLGRHDTAKVPRPRDLLLYDSLLSSSLGR